MNNKAKEFNAALRTDLSTMVEKSFQALNPGLVYVPSWHIEAMSGLLEMCYRRKLKRLIICAPPRSLKSHVVSIAFPAWLAGQDPTLKVLSISHSLELATQFSLDTRTVMSQEWYKKAFPGTRISKKKAEEDLFMTTACGQRRAADDDVIDAEFKATDEKDRGPRGGVI